MVSKPGFAGAGLERSEKAMMTRMKQMVSDHHASCEETGDSLPTSRGEIPVAATTVFKANNTGVASMCTPSRNERRSIMPPNMMADMMKTKTAKASAAFAREGHEADKSQTSARLPKIAAL